MEYIKQIAFFMVFSGIVLELCADTKYHKFSEWVVGVLLILQLVKPWFSEKPVWEQFLYRLVSFQYVLEAEYIPEELSGAEEHVERSVQSVYEKTLTTQIEGLLQENKLNLLVASYVIEQTTGELKQITVTAEYQTVEEDRAGQIEIEKIEPVTIGEAPVKQPDVVTPMEVYVKELLADFYGLPEQHINVRIQEEFLNGQ